MYSVSGFISQLILDAEFMNCARGPRTKRREYILKNKLKRISSTADLIGALLVSVGNQLF